MTPRTTGPLVWMARPTARGWKLTWDYGSLISGVQLGMGCALLIAAAFMMLGLLGLLPSGGSALVFEVELLEVGGGKP